VSSRYFAVPRFSANSSFVGCSTGKSAGLTPPSRSARAVYPGHIERRLSITKAVIYDRYGNPFEDNNDIVPDGEYFRVMYAHLFSFWVGPANPAP
jgi:hypothetical protein